MINDPTCPPTGLTVNRELMDIHPPPVTSPPDVAKGSNWLDECVWLLKRISIF